MQYSLRLPEFVAYRVPTFEPYPTPDVVCLNMHRDLVMHLWAQDVQEARTVAAEHFGRYLAARGYAVALAQMKAELAVAGA